MYRDQLHVYKYIYIYIYIYRDQHVLPARRIRRGEAQVTPLSKYIDANSGSTQTCYKRLVASESWYISKTDVKILVRFNSCLIRNAFTVGCGKRRSSGILGAQVTPVQVFVPGSH